MRRCYYFSHFTAAYTETEGQDFHLGLLGSTPGLFPTLPASQNVWGLPWGLCLSRASGFQIKPFSLMKKGFQDGQSQWWVPASGERAAPVKSSSIRPWPCESQSCPPLWGCPVGWNSRKGLQAPDFAWPSGLVGARLAWVAVVAHPSLAGLGQALEGFPCPSCVLGPPGPQSTGGLGDSGNDCCQPLHASEGAPAVFVCWGPDCALHIPKLEHMDSSDQHSKGNNKGDMVGLWEEPGLGVGTVLGP